MTGDKTGNITVDKDTEIHHIQERKQRIVAQGRMLSSPRENKG